MNHKNIKNIIFILSSIIIALAALAALIILVQLAIDLFLYIFIETELYWIVCPVGMVLLVICIYGATIGMDRRERNEQDDKK